MVKKKSREVKSQNLNIICAFVLVSNSEHIYRKKAVDLIRCICFVYNIPYRRAHAWPSGCIGRVRARVDVSCIQACVKNACNQGYQEDSSNATVGRKLLHFVCIQNTLSSRRAKESCIQAFCLPKISEFLYGNFLHSFF